jgi:hypothetical protein
MHEKNFIKMKDDMPGKKRSTNGPPRLFVLIAIAILVFALYAYFIDKPDTINGEFTVQPK